LSLWSVRGRARAGVLVVSVAGARAAGVAAHDVPNYVDELEALKAELAAADGRPHVIVEMCQEQRPEVRSYLVEQGFAEVTDPRVLTSFRP